MKLAKLVFVLWLFILLLLIFKFVPIEKEKEPIGKSFISDYRTIDVGAH